MRRGRHAAGTDRNRARRRSGVRSAGVLLVVAAWGGAQMSLAAPAAAAPFAPIGGQWTEATVPSGGGNVPELVSVACSGAETCVAAGSVHASPGAAPTPVVVTDDGGSLTTVVAGLLPSGALSGSLTSVSCAPGGACVAVGWAVGPDGSSGAFTVVVPDRTAGPVALVPGMTGTGVGASGPMPTISCPVPTWCLVIGPSSTGLVARAGVPGAWQPAPAPALGSVSAVDCPRRGACVAAAGRAPLAGDTARVLVGRYEHGRWGTETTDVLVPRGSAWSVTGLSCLSAEACWVTATGDGSFPRAGVAAALAVPIGRSGTARPEPTSFLATSPAGPFGPFGVACRRNGRCEVVGSDPAPGGGAVAFVGPGSAWAPVPVAGPGGGPARSLDAVWCGSTGVAGPAGGRHGRGPHGPRGTGSGPAPHQPPTPGGLPTGSAVGCVAVGAGVLATLVAVPGTELPVGAAGGVLLSGGLGVGGALALAVRARRRRLRP